MLINIGFGNVVNMDKVISIVRADAAPVKRMVQVARDGGMAVDATCGRKTKCVLVMDSGHIADDFFHVRDRRTEWRSYIRVDIWNNSLHLFFTGDRRGGFLPLL